jgi:acetyl esterase/lipase
MKRIKGLAYRTAEDTRNTGDLFLPGESASGRILMLIHGGGWQALDRHSVRGAAIEIACSSKVVVWTPDYRLLRHAPWPACLDDVEAAARRILTDPALPLPPPGMRRLAVAGFSAGAHLALMLGLERMPADVHCLVAGAPPTILGPDLYSHARDIFNADFGKRFFGREPGPADWRLASPLFRIPRAPLPPLLLLHNAKDYLVPPFHSRAMALRYRRKGGICRSCLFDGKAPSHDIYESRDPTRLSARGMHRQLIEAIWAFLSDHFQ